jgi:acetolactate synthase-1/2/3 large subunit
MGATDMTGGQALVASLAVNGVDTVFGIPGTHNLEIYRHLSEQGVRHVGTRHEQGAGYAADGYARTTGRPGVAVVTTGPALLNAATALAQAWSDSVPVLLVSPGMPLRHPALGNGLLHEARDQQAALAAVSAASLRATSVAEIPTAVAQAFALMLSGRPRPVHLEVPLDVLAETAAVEVTAPVHLPTVSPEPQAVSRAVERLAAARRPVVVAGGGCADATVELRHLAELLGAPVVTTTNGKGVLDEDHPLAIGAGVHLPSVRALVDEADVVLAVGTELAPADLWYGPLPLAGKLVRVDVDPVGIVTNASPDVAVVGDAALTLSTLAKDLEAREGYAARELEEAEAAAERWRSRKREDARTEGHEWVDVVDAMADALPRGTVVAADNAMACYYGAMANLPTYGPASFLFPTGFGTLGYGLPAAIGAKVAAPDRPVLAMLGDGGVMFTVQELATASDLGIALPVLVVDNAGYGEIRNEMRDRNDPEHAVTFGGTDFVSLAHAVGCHGVRLDRPAGLADALSTALAADRPTVIHLVTLPAPEGGTA